jgi:FkbM family methyltransferase
LPRKAQPRHAGHQIYGPVYWRSAAGQGQSACLVLGRRLAFLTRGNISRDCTSPRRSRGCRIRQVGMSRLITRVIDRALGGMAAKVAPIISSQLRSQLIAELTEFNHRARAEESSQMNDAPHRQAQQMNELLGVGGTNPSDVLRHKDVIMRNAFDGILMATRPDIVCDVGSFDGADSARFSRIAPWSRLYAFEANNDNIVRFIKSRSDLERVTIENIAVCEVDGEITFHILVGEGDNKEPPIWQQAAGSLHVRVNDIPSRPVTVPSVRLDTYFKREIENKSTFILWIDVEGALDRVLAGAKKVLEQTILLRAEVEHREFWAGQMMADEVISLAEKAGFLLLCDSWTPRENGQSDVLMINREWLHLAANSTNNFKNHT